MLGVFILPLLIHSILGAPTHGGIDISPSEAVSVVVHGIPEDQPVDLSHFLDIEVNEHYVQSGVVVSSSVLNALSEVAPSDHDEQLVVTDPAFVESIIESSPAISENPESTIDKPVPIVADLPTSSNNEDDVIIRPQPDFEAEAGQTSEGNVIIGTLPILPELVEVAAPPQLEDLVISPPSLPETVQIQSPSEPNESETAQPSQDSVIIGSIPTTPELVEVGDLSLPQLEDAIAVVSLPESVQIQSPSEQNSDGNHEIAVAELPEDNKEPQEEYNHDSSDLPPSAVGVSNPTGIVENEPEVTIESYPDSTISDNEAPSEEVLNPSFVNGQTFTDGIVSITINHITTAYNSLSSIVNVAYNYVSNAQTSSTQLV